MVSRLIMLHYVSDILYTFYIVVNYLQYDTCSCLTVFRSIKMTLFVINITHINKQ